MSNEYNPTPNVLDFYAESVIFQSPEPIKLPIPVFDENGHFVPGPWPTRSDNDLDSKESMTKILANEGPKF